MTALTVTQSLGPLLPTVDDEFEPVLGPFTLDVATRKYEVRSSFKELVSATQYWMSVVLQTEPQLTSRFVLDDDDDSHRVTVTSLTPDDLAAARDAIDTVPRIIPVRLPLPDD